MAPKISTYRHFGEEDFMNDPFFQEWILNPCSQKNDFWKQFVQQYPEKQAEVAAALHLLKSIRFKEVLPAPELVEQHLQQALAKIELSKNAQVPAPVRSYGFGWLAAAAAVLLLALGAWWFFSGETKTHTPTEVIAAGSNDRAPGSNKAVLTLSDGTKVVLDSTDNGAISKQGNVTVMKLNDGQLAYNYSTAQPLNSSALTYNTITTPRGGQYQLVLSDGTRVWLNAASSLRFPIAFTGSERRVELMGEGYFEVAHNKQKPFYVQAQNMKVAVLGTHFNINAYADEDAVKTTLLEGKVAASAANGQTVVLQPGQQARLSAASEGLYTLKHVDVEETIAWKNGYFSFNDAGIQTIMRQLSRWYNVDVVYEGAVPQVKFSGDMGRSLTLAQVLSILEETRIHYKMDEKKLIIMP